MSMRTPDRRYDPRELDAKWQERWDRDKLYQVRDDDPRPKWYELTMYPYPSGDLETCTLATGTPWPRRTPTPVSAECRATTSFTRWGLTPLGCRRRTRPYAEASTPISGQ